MIDKPANGYSGLNFEHALARSAPGGPTGSSVADIIQYKPAISQRPNPKVRTPGTLFDWISPCSLPLLWLNNSQAAPAQIVQAVPDRCGLQAHCIAHQLSILQL